MADWEQLVISYGLADSARYFDTSFVKFVLSQNKLPYSSRWGFLLSTVEANPSDEDTRLQTLLNIVPFDFREYYTNDSVFIWLYRIRGLSPKHNLENYSLILSLVVQWFVFDGPGHVICVSFFDERKKWQKTYVSEPSNP